MILRMEMGHFCGQMVTSFQVPLLMAGRLAMENTSTKMGTTTKACLRKANSMALELILGPMGQSM